MSRLMFGFKKYFEGLRYWVSTPALLKISIVPVLIDGVLFGAGFYMGLRRLEGLLNRMKLSPEGAWDSILYYGSLVFGIVLIFLFVTLFVFMIASLVAFPFHDLMAEKVLELEGALVGRPKGLSHGAKLMMSNLWVGVRKSLVFGFLTIFIFIASLIPGVNVVAGFFALLIVTYNFVDFSFDHLGFKFSERLSFFRQHGWEFLGFSFACGLTFAIPILNFVAFPGSVVAAAKLCADLRLKTERLK